MVERSSASRDTKPTSSGEAELLELLNMAVAAEASARAVALRLRAIIEKRNAPPESRTVPTFGGEQ